MFKGILIEKLGEKHSARLTELKDDQLPSGNVTVKVAYSTLNYKDALAITGKGPVVRSFPMVPGIDLAGTVESSDDPRYKPGDRVLLNGWGVGESHWGGLAQKARLNGDWLIPHPDRLTERESMAVGTAGYTAMLCVMALERHGLKPSNGTVLVTGATGGVGSFAISLLAGAGYSVTAVTGKVSEEAYLKSLGATTIIDRAELSAPGRPLAKEKWAAVIDSVGSHTLANACASTMSEGLVAACGLAQGMDFPATVAPFILRGISLLGINSVTQPFERRVEAWERLANQLNLDALSLMTRDIGIEAALPAAVDLLDGKIRGRLIVDVSR
ncbi:acrylyl-CoA reductase (NADPH) [Pseudomonas sp. Tn43]|jgi:acrylyl-CoA reductase (NADPH)|uniref:acrylyl-CoA reductase (NADPH) n=1 Tax=unclassified Pseudomonas TaxID=196821 RepID=UPI000BAB98E8|nr:MULTISPECIES: MDR family oxidoreductase [unclassified Pseudomonas]MBB3239116.1 acrylyl-CoA reductase (NADPH) [Pseudomonas sp. Tn43]PAU61156.1 alcohol dehydrogenase [Pseudomonas sp. PICF141]